MEIDRDEIGLQIRTVRKRLALTQQGFAELFNRNAPAHLYTTRVDIAKYEKGIMSMPAEKYVLFLSLDIEADPLHPGRA